MEAWATIACVLGLWVVLALAVGIACGRYMAAGSDGPTPEPPDSPDVLADPVERDH
jgi:hypothetical protein